MGETPGASPVPAEPSEWAPEVQSRPNKNVGEITFVQGQSDRRRALPHPNTVGVGAEGRGECWGTHTPPPTPTTDMNIYKDSGFLLHPPASRKPPLPASVGENPLAFLKAPTGRPSEPASHCTPDQEASVSFQRLLVQSLAWMVAAFAKTR